MIQIDGITWDVPCEIRRTAELTASEISGLLLDKTYFNDVQGTYMSYEVGLAVPMDRVDDYTQIYELLTTPVDGHAFVLPYNQSTVAVTGRVADVRDALYKTPAGNYWEGCRFTIIANHPTKTMSLSEVLQRGRTPLPELTNVPEGATYTYTGGVWVKATTYEDADDKYYPAAT